MALYKVNSGDMPLASDLDQLVDVLTGANDVGTVSLIGPIAAPAASFTAAAASGSGLGTGTYMYRLTYVSGYKKSNGSTLVQGETVTSGSMSVTTTSGNNAVTLGSLPSSWPTGVLGLRIYRTAVGGADGSQKLVTTLWTPQTTYTDTTADSSLGAAYPTSNTTGTGLTVGGGITVQGTANNIYSGPVQVNGSGSFGHFQANAVDANMTSAFSTWRQGNRRFRIILDTTDDIAFQTVSGSGNGSSVEALRMLAGSGAVNISTLLTLTNQSVPGLSFKTSQSGNQEWRWAGGYNDAQTISLVDVTGNAQALRVTKSGDLYTGRGNTIVTPNSSVGRLQNIVTSYTISSTATTGWQKLTTISFPVAFGSGNVSSITVQLQVTANPTAVAGGIMPQNVTATGFDLWANVQTAGATFYYNVLAFGQVV